MSECPLPTPIRILVVLGEGGHTTELLHLVDLLGPTYEYYYLLSSEDDQSAQKIRYPGPVFRVPRPRYNPGKRHHAFLDPWLTLRCLFTTIPVLYRVRPVAIITTGPWIGVTTALSARLLRVRVIFIETGSRVTTLSATGKVMRFLADDFFVQWEGLTQRIPSARFAGRLW